LNSLCSFSPSKKTDVAFLDPAVSFITFVEAHRNFETFALLSNLAERN